MIYIAHNPVHEGACSQLLRQVGDMDRIIRNEGETTMQTSKKDKYRRYKDESGNTRMKSVIKL